VALGVFVMIRRNTLWNLFGSAAPFLLGVVSVPYLVRHAGVERFGVLTIVWALIGYFSLFDFGLGRALTQQVSTNRALGQHEELASLVKTGLLFILIAGLLGGFLLAIFSTHLGGQWLNVNKFLQKETISSLFIASVGIPMTTLTTGLRGVLEAYEDFKTVNILRLFLGMANFGFPVISVIYFGPSLPHMVASLVVARLFILYGHLYLVKKHLPIGWMKAGFDRLKMRGLLSFGAWMTVSNVVSPLMVVADRFVVSSILGAEIVAYYTVPSDLLIRLLIVPGALAAALFPRLTSLMMTEVGNARSVYMRSVKLTGFVMLPMCLCVALGSYWGLTFWLGEEFAQHAWKVTTILSIGIFFNGLAQIPFAAVQAAGKAKETAMLHLTEFVFYVPLLFLLLHYFGLAGAAISWVIRSGVDLLALLVMANNSFKKIKELKVTL
jgi:O-antigen/teichoic acid export membrane protein